MNLCIELCCFPTLDWVDVLTKLWSRPRQEYSIKVPSNWIEVEKFFETSGQLLVQIGKVTRLSYHQCSIVRADIFNSVLASLNSGKTVFCLKVTIFHPLSLGKTNKKSELKDMLCLSVLILLKGFPLLRGITLPTNLSENF